MTNNAFEFCGFAAVSNSTDDNTEICGKKIDDRTPEEAEAFLGLAHSFLSKLRAGHFSSKKPPETAATPFFQVAIAVDEACAQCAQTGDDLWDDWDVP
jgi:hypothetical protein